MSEPRETLEAVFQRLDDEDTAEQIAAELNNSAVGDFQSAETKAAAAAVHAELLKRLETIPDAETRLAVARAARSHFRQIAAENTEKYVAHSIETEWRRDQALRHYYFNRAARPANSKYSLEEIAAYRDGSTAVSSAPAQQVAPEIEEGEI